MAELKIGYARVSTVDQDLTAQRDALAGLGVEPKRVYVDHGITGTNRERPGLREALAACRRGDTLVVTKLDRLARSVPDARDIVDELTAGGVRLNIGGFVHDPTDPIGRLLFTTLSMIAEFEADLARARTREGMAVARAKGRLRGKQPKLSPRQEAHLVELYRAGGHTIGELEELLPVTRSTVYRALARAGGPYRAVVGKARAVMDELLVARNPDPDSRLEYLLRLPLGGGMVFRTSGTWPRAKALYCYPVIAEDWPAEPDIVERAPIRSCVRRGAAIDLILDRGRENRSQLVFTTARGREAVFWQSPPIVFCETRQLAEEWIYRYLAAAHAWVETEQAVSDRISISVEANETVTAPETAPSTAEVRAWARAAGIAVPDRGRLHPDIWHAWRGAQPK